MKEILVYTISKIGLKKVALKMYFFLFNLKDQLVKGYRDLLIPYLIKKRSRNGVYAVNLDSDWIGLGARIVKTIEILLYCEEHKLIPLIKYGYKENKKVENNYFEELFQYKITSSADNQISFTHIRDIDELHWKEDYNKKLKLKTAKLIFDKYLCFNKTIIKEVEEFTDIYFSSKQVLGVHYRGTDKSGEAPLIKKEDLLINIKQILNNNNYDVVFISTDDQLILEFILHSNLSVPVIYRKDQFRSKDGEQFHRKKVNSKSIINRDAIVNMLLLSKCSFLLKTASILSDCSVVFNPFMPVKLLSKPHSENLTWWPATEIIENLNRNNLVDQFTSNAIIKA